MISTDTENIVSSLNDEIHPFRITLKRSSKEGPHIWIDIYVGRNFIRGFSSSIHDLKSMDYSRIVFEALERGKFNMDNPIQNYLWECKKTTRPVNRKDLQKILLMEDLK